MHLWQAFGPAAALSLWPVERIIVRDRKRKDLGGHRQVKVFRAYEIQP
jgi:hypothetical protein